MSAPPPPPPDEPYADPAAETFVAPGAERRVVVDEEPVPVVTRSDPWPWLLAALATLAAILFLVLWLTQRDTGPKTNLVPNLIGTRQVQAQRDALARGYFLKTVQRVAASPPGTVIDQAPEPGVELQEHARIMIVVSTGRAEASVPDVTGLKVDAAKVALKTAKLGAQVRVVKSDKPASSVLSQSPPAGSKVAKGSNVTLVVSQGPALVAVPALRGLTVEKATALLQSAGLSVNVVQVPSPEPAGTVVAQDPPRGQKVKRGSQVQINVAQSTQTTTSVTTTATTVTVPTTTVVTTTPTP